MKSPSQDSVFRVQIPFLNQKNQKANDGRLYRPESPCQFTKPSEQCQQLSADLIHPIETVAWRRHVQWLGYRGNIPDQVLIETKNGAISPDIHGGKVTSGIPPEDFRRTLIPPLAADGYRTTEAITATFLLVVRWIF